MIHPTAIVDPGARLGENVVIGPYSIIGDRVEIGDNCEIGPHVLITGPTRLGVNNRIYAFAAIGGDPQDKKYADEDTFLEIGDNNTIREYCTINRGTAQDVGITRVGNDNWIMAYVHIAHDCQVGSHTIFANNASLAGHVHIGDHVILGGYSLVHQFCHIGAHAFTALNSIITKDVPPFLMVAGRPAKPNGLNSEGLSRRGFSKEAVKAIKDAYRMTYRAGNTLEQAKQSMASLASDFSEVKQFLDFINASQRGVIR